MDGWKPDWRPGDPDPSIDICEFMHVIPPGKFKRKLVGNWRIKGLIPKAGLGAIYGPSGEGKTFVALDLAMTIARGVPWRGRKAERAAVLYLSPDGGEMVQNRFFAYCQHHGVDPDDPDDHSLFLAPRPIDLLNRGGRHGNDGTTAALATIERIEAAYGVKIGVVMIDTASRVMPGGDENAAKDVTRFIDNMAAIAGEGRAVIAIHHTPKSDSTVLRGHSALHGACDFELNVNDRQITVAKQREGESGQVLGFDLAVEEIGVDEDGEPVTSCVAVEADGTERVPRDGLGRMSPSSVIALRTVENLIAQHGEDLPCGGGFPSSPHQGVPARLVLETLKGSIFHDCEPEPARKRWERLRDGLHSKGLIGVCNGWLWIPRNSASDSRDRDGHTVPRDASKTVHRDGTGRSVYRPSPSVPTVPPCGHPAADDDAGEDWTFAKENLH